MTSPTERTGDPTPKAVAYTVRFPQDLFYNLKELAQSEKRSFNSEVIYLLEVAVNRIVAEGEAKA